MYSGVLAIISRRLITRRITINLGVNRKERCMDERELNDRLQAEYLHLQKVVEDFDGRVVTIKAWSVSFSLVAFLGAFAAHSDGALLVASATAFLFWFLEAYWKQFQFVYYRRCDQIEAHFRGESSLLHPFQIAVSWQEHYRRRKVLKLLRTMFWPNVCLPHAAIFLVGLILFYLVQIGYAVV